MLVLTYMGLIFMEKYCRCIWIAIVAAILSFLVACSSDNSAGADTESDDQTPVANTSSSEKVRSSFSSIEFRPSDDDSDGEVVDGDVEIQSSSVEEQSSSSSCIESSSSQMIESSSDLEGDDSSSSAAEESTDTFCGDMEYNPETHFCLMVQAEYGLVYYVAELCDGQKYEDYQYCEDGEIVTY